MSRLEQPEAGSSPLHFANQYPQPLWRQTLIILVKNLVRRLPASSKLSPSCAMDGRRCAVVIHAPIC